MMDLVELSSKSSVSADYFDAKFEEISAEINDLQAQLGERKQQAGGFALELHHHGWYTILRNSLNASCFALKVLV